MAEVALEAGNSPDMIFQHYRELATGEAAKEWFGVTPAVIQAEAKQLKEEAARLRAKRAAEAEKAAKKQRRKTAASAAEVPAPTSTAPVLTVLPAPATAAA